MLSFIYHDGVKHPLTTIIILCIILHFRVPFWFASCRSIVIGLHCGSEAEEAAGNFFNGVQGHNKQCGPIFEELQPLYETFRTVIEAEQRLKNAIRKRK